MLADTGRLHDVSLLYQVDLCEDFDDNQVMLIEDNVPNSGLTVCFIMSSMLCQLSRSFY